MSHRQAKLWLEQQDDVRELPRDEATPTPLPKWGVGGRALPFFGKRRASAIGRLWLWCLLRNGAAVHLRCCGVAATRCEAAEGGLGAPLLVESSHASARRFSPDTQNGPVHPSVRLRLASRARLPFVEIDHQLIPDEPR